MKIVWLVLLIYSTCAGLSQMSPPAGKRAIICLTYDDELESHQKVVIPQLDALGLKATFFLTSIRGSGVSDLSLLGWKKAAQSGHELGNHTLFHPCPEKFGWPKELSIESYTIDRLLNEIAVTNSYLTTIDGKEGKRAFAYPCNNTFVQGLDYSGPLKQTGLVTYARTGGDRTSIIRDFSTVDLMKVPSWLVDEGTTLAELIAFAEEVKQGGRMGVYQLHGIGGPPFNVAIDVHNAFLDYLAARGDEYWVTTLSEAMDHVIGLKHSEQTHR